MASLYKMNVATISGRILLCYSNLLTHQRNPSHYSHTGQADVVVAASPAIVAVQLAAFQLRTLTSYNASDHVNPHAHYCTYIGNI